MRELKFRAWDTESKEWCGIDMGYADDSHGPISIPVVFNGQNNCVIMQYTGLKDKNGVEIYEGDIVKQHDGTYVIEYEIAAFVGVPIIEGRKVGRPKNSSIKMSYMNAMQEVIGNIYENPELLTGDSNE